MPILMASLPARNSLEDAAPYFSGAGSWPKRYLRPTVASH